MVVASTASTEPPTSVHARPVVKPISFCFSSQNSRYLRTPRNSPTFCAVIWTEVSGPSATTRRAILRAIFWRITPVIPYYPYARQDRKDRPRVAISAKLVADLLETAGSSRVLSLDLHAPQIQGYFNIPVDHLYAAPVLVEYFQKKKLGPVTVVSPDAGGVERARLFAKRMDAPLAIVDKRRIDINVSEVMHLIGDVAGRPALVIDDIIDTAGTLVKTAEALLENGATKVFAACTHPVLSGPAVERIQKSAIEEVVVTDSVPLNDAAKSLSKIKVLSVAPLLARGIQSIHEETSISELFI